MHPPRKNKSTHLRLKLEEAKKEDEYEEEIIEEIDDIFSR